MTAEQQLRWVHPPLQNRSQKTMERLLSAAEACITEVGFERATIAQIAKRAESSVGAFYARFSDKDALLRCLIDRFVFEAKATMDASMNPALWEGKSIERICRELLSFLASVLQQRRLFVVAIAKASMEDASVAEVRSALSTHAAAGLLRLLETRQQRPRQPNVETAMRVVTWVCVSVLETSCVGATESAGGVDKEEFLGELATMLVAYLGIPGEPAVR